MPFLDEFALCDNFHWSYEQCEATPPVVRQVFLMILEARESARKSKLKH